MKKKIYKNFILNNLYSKQKTMKKLITILILSFLLMINFTTFADSKTYLELNTEYNLENSKETDVDYKKLDSITEEITNKVKSEENLKNYNKYTKVFKLVLNKAKKDNQNFWEFYNYWIKFRYQIDDYLSTWKTQDESKLEQLYTIQTVVNETVNWLCDKIWGCWIWQDNSKLLKEIQ